MTLSEKQMLFTKYVYMLIQKASELGIGLTFGHAWRSIEEQTRLVNEGKSKTMQSKHLKRLAVDFNFFLNHKTLTWKKEDIQELGDYWESLHPENQWGGNWTSFLDVPHFQSF